MRQPKLDPAVEKYLKDLRRAVAVLPADRRREVLDEIRAHVTVALAEGESPELVIARLGTPETIVEEAQVEVVTPGQFPGRDVAVMLLMAMTFVFTVIAWLIAVFAVRRSRAWTTSQKWIGLVAWPWGLYAMNLLITRWPFGPAQLATGPFTWLFWMSMPFGTFAWTGAVYLYLRHPARIARQRAKRAEGSVLHRTLGDSFTLRRSEPRP